MKRTLLLSYSLAIALCCFSQDENYKCSCSKVGLDPLWADSNSVSCYLIPVPRKTAKPSDGKFYLAAAVAPSINKSNQPPLLYLHGGPGIATLENIPRYLKSETWKLLRAKRSFIFFDYRGTGFSEPALCLGIEDSLLRFSGTNASQSAQQAYKISLLKKCREDLAASNIDVSSFNSAQLAKDAEVVRQALKIDNWNIYGVSYGTTVALNMLRQSGKHINSVILDSPFPPNAPWLDFIRPFDTCFKVLEKSISGDPVAFSHFPSLRKDFVNAVARLNKKPAKIKLTRDGHEQEYRGDDFAWSIWSAMLNPRSIPFVPLAIHEVGNGNDSILVKWMGAFNDPNAFGMFSEAQSKAIICFESRPKNAGDSKASLLAHYPDFSSLYIDFEGALCDTWQPESARAKMFRPVKSDVPVLVLSGEYDPVCPPLFGEITARTLRRSTFIIVPSASHAAIHTAGCMADIADGFLSNPKLKPITTCLDDRGKIEFKFNDLEKTLIEFKQSKH